MSRSPNALLWTVLGVLVVLTLPLAAQENLELGKMWTFENPPLEYLQAVYGFSPSQEWLDTTRLSSLRFGRGCSASFVSSRGLILTNHHCVRSFVAAVSPPDEDWVRDGFVARSPEEEVKVPGLTVQQLVSMENVTDRVNEGIDEGDDDQTIDRKRRENQRRIQQEARGETPGLRAQMVTLYQGAMFQLYRYKVYDDIRLAAAPHLQTAHFGGDPDNFTYPRFGIDFALCRAYEDGKPADTAKHYFKWSSGGPQDGELVFVTGNPGSTDRIRTLAELEFMRDILYPIRLEGIDRRIELLQEHAARGEEEAKAVRTELLGLQNSQKAFRGFLTGLRDSSLMAQKREAETAFRTKVAADPALARLYGPAWESLEDICRQKRELEPRQRFQTFQGWDLLQLGFHLARAGNPAASDEARAANLRQARELQISDSEVDRASYADHLDRARRWLGPDDPFLQAILGGKEPHQALETLVQKTKLSDADYVKNLLNGDAKSLQENQDPLISVGRILAPLMLENQDLRQRLAAEESVQTTRIGQAIFAVYGTKVSPDATFTLRLSDGVVKGFPFNGTLAPWRTSFYGLYARNCEFNNQYPFDLPPIWLERMDRIDLKKSVNFVSTNDIVGGNSGSPLINKNQEIVGLAFDGNIESLPNRFVFREDVPRTVSVHSEAIIEALRKIYDAPSLADELQGRRGPR